jgi:hypothetical protein
MEHKRNIQSGLCSQRTFRLLIHSLLSVRVLQVRKWTELKEVEVRMVLQGGVEIGQRHGGLGH